MAATTAGAIKSYLEAQGLGISVYRDRAPEGQPMPYVSVTENISLVPAPFEGYSDASRQTVTETVQIDLWEKWKNDDGTLAESYTLGTAIYDKLHGARLPAAPGRVYQLTCRNLIRTAELDNNIIQKTITAVVARQL